MTDCKRLWTHQIASVNHYTQRFRDQYAEFRVVAATCFAVSVGMTYFSVLPMKRGGSSSRYISSATVSFGHRREIYSSFGDLPAPLLPAIERLGEPLPKSKG